MVPIRPALALILALMLPGALGAQEPMDEQGESADRYAQVKVVEGDVTVHKGETDEPMSRGLPIAEGDVLESRGRGLLQLGDGSVVAFGPETRFRVAALFTEQGRAQRVLLVLDRGELRVRKGTYSEALIRVDTPSGSGTLGDPADLSTRSDATWIIATEPRGTRVSFLVHEGGAVFANGRSQARIFAGQRLTVYGGADTLQRVSDFNGFTLDDFDAWADDLMKPRLTPSADKVPPELRYYADELDACGTWSYRDDCSSYCWTPSGVAEDWRPYADGSWDACDGGLTWVGDEPWGFLTEHFGCWDWDPGLGWYWIPGLAYSPAWVAWNCAGGYFGWAPLGWRHRPSRWGRGPSGGGACWNVVTLGSTPARNLRGRLVSDPAVLRTFAAAPSWSLGRMMVGNAEFHDPAKFQSVLAQPALGRQRVAAYVRTAQAATGRTFLASSGALPHSQAERLEAEHPLLRPQPQHTFGPSPAAGSRTTGEDRGRAPRPLTGGRTLANGIRESPAAALTPRGEPRPAYSEPHPAPQAHPAPAQRSDDGGRTEARPAPAKPAPPREPAPAEHREATPRK